MHVDGKGGAIFAHVHTLKVHATTRYDRFRQPWQAVVNVRVDVGRVMQPDELLAGVAMHLPRGRVGLDDIAVQVVDDQTVARRFEDLSVLLLLLPELLLCLLAIANIADHAQIRPRLRPWPPDQGRAHLHWDTRPVSSAQ